MVHVVLLRLRFHSFDEHLRFLRDILSRQNDIYLAVDSGDRVIGLMATDGEYLNQLYVHPDCQRLGIGSRLLSIARDRSGGRLRLYTFEINHQARCFYEQHGFRPVARGGSSEEGLADILYEWSADDSPG